MASSGIRRKVDDLGRVVIPAGMRRTLGIREGDPVEVSVEGERVVLAKPRDACVFCGREEEDLTGFRGRLVCRDCLASLGSVQERLRATTAGAPSPPAAPSRRSPAELPDWDVPRQPQREPATDPAARNRPAPGAGVQEPASAARPRPVPAAGSGPKEPAAPEESTPDELAWRPREQPRDQPPQDPPSTTAW